MEWQEGKGEGKGEGGRAKVSKQNKRSPHFDVLPKELDGTFSMR